MRQRHPGRTFNLRGAYLQHNPYQSRQLSLRVPRTTRIVGVDDWFVVELQRDGSFLRDTSIVEPWPIRTVTERKVREITNGPTARTS